MIPDLRSCTLILGGWINRDLLRVLVPKQCARRCSPAFGVCEEVKRDFSVGRGGISSYGQE